MRLYLDVETYRERKEDAFINEMVIAIGVIEDPTPYSPESAKMWRESGVEFKSFTIWGVGGKSVFEKGKEKERDEREKKLIREFTSISRGLLIIVREIILLIVIGFNILRYDIPLLIQKGVGYGVASLGELNALWHGVFIIDYFQTSLPFHGMRFKDLKLDLIVRWAKRAGVWIPERYGSGKDIAEWFKNRQYNDIIEHLRKDLEITCVIDLNSMNIYKAVLENSICGKYPTVNLNLICSDLAVK